MNMYACTYICMYITICDGAVQEMKVQVLMDDMADHLAQIVKQCGDFKDVVCVCVCVCPLTS